MISLLIAVYDIVDVVVVVVASSSRLAWCRCGPGWDGMSGGIWLCMYT